MASNPGIDRLIARLETLGKDATKLVKKALAEPLKVVQKAARAGLGASGLRDTNRAIWRSIGRKVYTKGGFITGAKVGFGVGMKNPRQRLGKGETDQAFADRKAKTRNIVSPVAHLLSMGTQHRWTGSVGIRKKLKDGRMVVIGQRNTGNPRQYRGFIKPNPYFRTSTGAATPAAKEAFAGAMDSLVKQTLGK